MKGERTPKRSYFGIMGRKRLSDITNTTTTQTKPSSQLEKPQAASPDTEDLINQLIKEKITLMKLLEERNKIIELSGTELQNMRVNLQKLQLQNLSLAQSNSQMLAELNLGRERLRTLQHELVCKNTLLKAKNLEKELNADVNCQEAVSAEGEEAASLRINEANNHQKPSNNNRRRVSRSQSMGPSTTCRRGLEKERTENKRRCLKRQSARFKSQEREASENLFEIEDAKFAVTEPLDTPMHGNGPAPLGSSTVTKEETCDPKIEAHGSERTLIGRPVRKAEPLDTPMHENGPAPLGSSSITKEETCDPKIEAQGSRRTSVGRPVRKAVEKVQSYKEIPVNIKLRRQE